MASRVCNFRFTLPEVMGAQEATEVAAEVWEVWAVLAVWEVWEVQEIHVVGGTVTFSHARPFKDPAFFCLSWA